MAAPGAAARGRPAATRCAVGGRPAVRPAPAAAPRATRRPVKACAGPAAHWARARSRSPPRGPALYDVVGLGEALVDVSASVDDGFLAGFGVAKGGRRVVSSTERARLLSSLDAGADVAAGGSAANTLRALARLGAADDKLRGSGPLRVAMSPVAGTDAQGAFHAAALGNSGVSVLPGCVTAADAAATGTVFVLTTPDANRTFLSHVAFAGPLAPSADALAAASSCRLLLVEGYLWAAPGAEAAIATAVDAAREGGALVAFTGGDAGVVARHRDAIWRALQAGAADVVFVNAAEAAALLCEESLPANEAALALGPVCGMAAVTDGANGAALVALGELHVVPPVWREEPPVDTNGAGDAFAAGALFGLLAGMAVPALGRAGARAASEVIARPGAALTDAEAARVVQALRTTPAPAAAPHSPASWPVASLDEAQA